VGDAISSNIYIATFHSHFGALQYSKALERLNVTAKLIPAPRQLSASCGTCVYYQREEPLEIDGCELDGVYLESEGTLECVLQR